MNAPIGLAFYDAEAFPAAYRGDAFVAMHGSWNAYPATGYKVVRIVFDNEEPARFEDFVTGFLNSAGDATFGRPAGVTVTKDGALLFSDDSNGYIYRVHYGESAADAGAPDAGASLDAGASDAGS